MIHSMTAFARAQKQVEAGLFCWELRSVNHRYLDVSFRLPEPFRQFEASFRASLRSHVNRGKLECQLKFQSLSADNQSMLINEGLVNALVGLSEQLSLRHQLANDLSASQVLAWPGVIQEATLDSDELGRLTLSLFEDALSQLAKARLQEGTALKAHVEERLQGLVNEVSRAKTLSANLAGQAKDKLLSRLQAVRLEVNEARVEQEIALILARLDVSEELDRLQTHCNEVARTLNVEKVAGRRLDFLMQELNREANTLSSKSDSIELTQSALEMKVLIEQMREQIQNIE